MNSTVKSPEIDIPTSLDAVNSENQYVGAEHFQAFSSHVPLIEHPYSVDIQDLTRRGILVFGGLVQTVSRTYINTPDTEAIRALRHEGVDFRARTGERIITVDPVSLVVRVASLAIFDETLARQPGLLGKYNPPRWHVMFRHAFSDYLQVHITSAKLPASA